VYGQDYLLTKGQKQITQIKEATASETLVKQDRKTSVSVVKLLDKNRQAGPVGKQQLVTDQTPPSLKSTTAVSVPWSESFDTTPFPPTTWTRYQAYSGTTWARSTSTAYRHSGAGAAFHNYAASPQESWLVTPQISVPATGGYALTFYSKVNWPGDYYYNGVWISTGSGVPANDFEEVWSPLDYADYPQDAAYNTVWIETNIFLSDDYAGKDIYIAFVYAGESYNHGWAIDDVKIDSYTPPATDLAITKTATGYTKLPVKHAAGFNFSASVKNSGLAIATPVTLSVTANNPESYTGSATISTLGIGAEKSFTASPSFSTASRGNYTATFNVNYPDATPANNTATASFEVTDQAFATDKGTFVSGVGAVNTPFGNIYELKTPDAIGSVSLAFSQILPLEFKIRIYGVKADLSGVTSATPIYESGVFNRSEAEAAHTFHQYDITPQTLPAGKYLFAIIAAANPVISYDAAAGGAFYLVNATGAFAPYLNSSYGNLAIRANTIFDYDASITAITAPVTSEPLTNAESVTVTIANKGLLPFNTASVNLYLDGVLKATETYTGTIAPSATNNYTFTTKLNLSESGKIYTIKASVVLANDGVSSNNDFSKKVRNLSPSVKLYGYRIYEDGSTVRSIVSFNSNTPGTVAVASNYTDGAYSVASGEYYAGKLYLYTRPSSGTAYHFVTLSTDTWTEVAKTNVTVVPNDLSYDYSTDILYAISGSPSVLSSVNLTTGALTAIRTLDRYYLTLSADLDGNLYGIDVSGNFVKINKAASAGTVIGFTGITPNYIQSASFDHNTGRLFWGMSNVGEEGKLVEVFPATGESYDFGYLGGNIELVALFTPYTYVPATLTSTTPSNGAPNVTITTPLSATFSKAVRPGSNFNAITVKDDKGVAVEITPSVTGNVLTIAHADFAYNKTYTVTIPVGALGGYSTEPITWSFTTAMAYIHPVSTIPAANATDVSPFKKITTIKVDFNNPIDINGPADFSNLSIVAGNGTPFTGFTYAVSGNALTISHDDEDLAYLTTYTVKIPAGSVVGYANDFSWSFTTSKDELTLISVLPANQSTGISINTPISLEFNKDPETNGPLLIDNISIKDAAGTPIALVGDKFEVVPIGDRFYLNILHGVFKYNTPYVVHIPAGTIRGYDKDIIFTFVTELAGIEVEGTTPVDRAREVSLTTPINATFSLPVDINGTPNLGFITVKDHKGNKITVSASYSGNTISIEHPAFSDATTYTVVIPKVSVIGLTEDYVWSFRTPTIPIAVQSFTPGLNAQNVAINSPISITFDKPVNTNASVDPRAISVVDADGNKIGISVSVDLNIVTISHTVFAASTEYTVTISDDAIYGITDLQWKFTTAAHTLYVNSFVPAASAKNVGLDTPITVAFDANIEINAPAILTGITINGAPAPNVEILGNILTIAHNPFVKGTTYTVVIPASAIAGFAGLTWSFTTGDVLALESVAPASGANSVAVNAAVVAKFDHNVDFNGTVYLDGVTIKTADGRPVLGVSASFSGRELTIAHATFNYSTAYTVSIPSNVIVGFAGYSWSFTTEPAAVSITSVTPANNAVGVTTTAPVRVIYAQNVGANVLTGVTIVAEGGAALGGVQASILGNVLTVDHNRFAPNTRYTVTIPANAVKGYAPAYSWSFTTGQGTGLEDAVNTSVNVYPTLTKGNVKVLTPADAKIRVLDLSGRTLANYKSSGDFSLDLNYTNGIYIISVESEHSVSIHKVILNR
jgi:hypothetical protein